VDGHNRRISAGSPALNGAKQSVQSRKIGASESQEWIRAKSSIYSFTEDVWNVTVKANTVRDVLSG